MAIKQPRNTKDGHVSIVWNNGAANRINGVLKAKQKIVDSESLRLCSPLIPFRTGTLERSGTTGTVLGSGNLRYTASYARKQYYNTPAFRSYDPKRGGKWFERMKTANRKHINDLINKK